MPSTHAQIILGNWEWAHYTYQRIDLNHQNLATNVEIFSEISFHARFLVNAKKLKPNAMPVIKYINTAHMIRQKLTCRAWTAK